jgi:agmatine/peptidylarginine deiminase
MVIIDPWKYIPASRISTGLNEYGNRGHNQTRQMVRNDAIDFFGQGAIKDTESCLNIDNRTVHLRGSQ